jgi:hypothetical protein
LQSQQLSEQGERIEELENERNATNNLLFGFRDRVKEQDKRIEDLNDMIRSLLNRLGVLKEEL